MNTLITGGYGFIGSFVAERFFKEGHKIHIIDNLSAGQKANVPVPHKFYQLNVEDRKCEEVFRSVSPDIVIHLAAQVDVASSLETPHLDTQANILGLVNILKCSARSKVEKLVFASSAAVYGAQDGVSLSENAKCDPVSPYGINKYLGEYYCAKWNELYGLKTLAFRFSNVYGPRQGSVGEGGVVSIFMERLRDGKELIVHGDGGQTRDFIYVEDVVDGIYRGAMSQATGVYNLSTNTETSVNQLVDALGELRPTGPIKYSEARQGDIYRSTLDNARVKRDLDWVPIYNVRQGLQRTFDWFMQSIPADKEKTNRTGRRKKSGWQTRLKPFAENALAFAVLACLTVFGSELLVQTSLDFKLIYVILLGVIYGTQQSVISAVLASGLYIYESLHNGREWVSLLYDPEALLVIAIYLFFGLVVGYVSDKSRRDSVRVKNELQSMKDKYSFLKVVYQDTRTVKEELQRQLINSKDSIGRVHGIIKSLESLEPEEIVTSSVKVLSDLLDTDRISIYSVNQSDFIRLMIKSGATDFNLSKTIRLSENPHLQDVARKGTLFVNKRMEAELPMLVAPVVHEGQVVALVSLHEPAFDKLNLNYENLFKVSVDLISGSLSRAFQYVGATKNERFIDESAIMTASKFMQVLQTRKQAKQQYNTDFVLLEVDAPAQSLMTMSGQIAGSLRDSDYLGLVKDKLVLLLSNSNPIEADFVMQRLSKIGVRTRMISEDEVYD